MLEAPAQPSVDLEVAAARPACPRLLALAALPTQGLGIYAIVALPIVAGWAICSAQGCNTSKQQVCSVSAWTHC